MSLSKPLALVIEDDPDAAEIFSKAVFDAGFEVEVIMTGDEALKRLDTARPALVVLDMHLPHVAGTEILEHARSSAPLASTRFIIITGDLALANEPVFQKQDVVQILVKPVTYRRLRDLAQLLRVAERGMM
ncbi:MAG: response regulator [Anaerolineae bacterium]|nr:response regulator [Anaerolineae bacterium]